MKVLFKNNVLRAMRGAGAYLPNQYPDKTIFLKDSKGHLFFGYYDISPFHSSNSFILAMRSSLGKYSPHDVRVPLEIGYFDLDKKNPEFEILDHTNSWNWQQGCRLQWYNHQRNECIFNSFENGKYISKIIKVGEQPKITKILDNPIYSLCIKTGYALTLDFERLHRNRAGYGYNILGYDCLDKKTAFQMVDLSTGVIVKDFTYTAIHSLLPKSDFDEDYINHLSISPNGKNFIFFYITRSRGKRKTSLILGNVLTDELVSLVPDISPSHYTWVNGENLLITGTKEDGMRYFIVNIMNGQYTSFFPKKLMHDGHPTMVDKEIFITDTYPSRTGFQSLLLGGIGKGEVKAIASFYSPNKYAGEFRCDLHPRPSQRGDKVAIDFVCGGKRAMAIIPINSGLKTS